MRRNVLLSAVALMMAANVFAQEDVTPASFKFKDLTVGPVQMYWGTGANPSVAELNVAGSIVAGVAPANITTEEAISSGLSIVDSEFGHLLLLPPPETNSKFIFFAPTSRLEANFIWKVTR